MKCNMSILTPILTKIKTVISKNRFYFYEYYDISIQGSSFTSSIKNFSNTIIKMHIDLQHQYKYCEV